MDHFVLKVFPGKLLFKSFEYVFYKGKRSSLSSAHQEKLKDKRFQIPINEILNRNKSFTNQK